MKKLLKWVYFFCMMLSVLSCGDNIEEKYREDSGHVVVTVNFPEGEYLDYGIPMAATRTQVAERHVLRCIMELRNRDKEGEVVYRNEVIVETVEQPLTFDFHKLPGGDYDCLFWADYIDADAVLQEKGSGISLCEDEPANSYKDKYYDTSDLENVTAVNIEDLINNPYSEAFYYTGLLKKETMVFLESEVLLERPFAKICLLENDLQKFNQLHCVIADLAMPQSFNVVKAAVTGEWKEVHYGDLSFNAEKHGRGNILTCFVFTDDKEDENIATMGSIRLKFNEEEATVTEVPTGIIPLLNGHCMKVTGNILANLPDKSGCDVSYDIDVDDWTESSQELTENQLGADELGNRKPQVGDFLLADGTISYVWSDNPEVVGIVFAIAAEKTDNSDYGGKTPAAYAMAIENIAVPKNLLSSPVAKSCAAIVTESSAWESGSYGGYTHTMELNKAVTSSDLQDEGYIAYETWCSANRLNAEKVSDWYIPSARQLLDCLGLIWGYTPNQAGTDKGEEKIDIDAEVKAAYEIVSTKKDNPFSAKVNIYSSSLKSENRAFGIKYESSNKITPERANGYKLSGGSNNAILPVITIFQ